MSPRLPRPRHHRDAAPRAHTGPGEPSRAGKPAAARAIWIALVALVLARAALAFVPTMWAWGLNLQRFLPPLEGWGLWALSALALVPALAARLEPGAARVGDAATRTPGAPYVVLGAIGAAAALLVWVLPDQLYFVGDFLLRFGAAKNGIPAASLFPQAQPLDLFLHHAVPAWLARAFSSDVLSAERVLGALEAAGFAVLAVLFVRALGLRGAPAFAAGATVLMSGALWLFTGYGKSIRELCVVTLAAGVLGLHVVRSGRGLVALGLATAAGLALHRSALALLVPFAVSLALGFRHYGRGGGWRRATTIAGVAIPLAVLVMLGPHIAGVIRSRDVSQAAPGGTGFAHAILAALRGEHPRELANLLLLLSPACVPGLVAMLASGTRPGRGREGVLLLSLAAAFAVPLFFVYPTQGVFRDTDVFAAAALALAMVAAWALGGALESSARPAGLAIALTLAAAVPATQWLLANHELPSGLARVRAYLEESPPRSDRDRTLAWDYLGTRMSWLDSLNASADAFARSATITPTPRLLYKWAQAEAARGAYAPARDILRQLTAKAETWPDAWAALAFVSQQLADTSAARAAAARALELNPRDEMARDVLEAVGRGGGGAGPPR